ncbi:MAG TPA: sugar-binding transcriptional regulator [Aggregatilineales bacterium]|nr:sugar-binding transcriptional regulator [Aggregatilineales bacterium]
METQDGRLKFLLSVARAYYEQGLSQEEIARGMAISRSQISRYLSEAREMGIVQIRVMDPYDRDVTLAEQLTERFKLRTAVVVPVLSRDDAVLIQMIGMACASYVKQAILPGECLCTGCGRSVRASIAAIRSHPIANLTVVQAMGSIGHEALNIDFDELTRAAADAFSARAYYVNAPAIMGSGTAADLERANITIRESLARARAADVFLVGIGSLDRDQLYARAGLVSQEELDYLEQRDAVGDICGRFFDIRGVEVLATFSDRTVGISLRDLVRGRLAIAVAGGREKVMPLRAALCGGWINVVVTDDETARAILALDQDLEGGKPTASH